MMLEPYFTLILDLDSPTLVYSYPQYLTCGQKSGHFVTPVSLGGVCSRKFFRTPELVRRT
jgi:hypothetical protein